jgi:1-phosphatidylinositol-4-phosphate 5-kinase
MSSDKSQISPIPPEGYGERFIKFISAVTMTKEEQEREIESGEQLDGNVDTARQQSFHNSRKSNEAKITEKAETQAHKTEMDGAIDEPHRDRPSSAARSPSVERSGGITGPTLPVVEEVGEAASREDSVQDEKAGGGGALTNGTTNSLYSDERPPPTPEKDKPTPLNDQPPNTKQLPSLPNFNRLSLGLQSSAPSASER